MKDANSIHTTNMNQATETVAHACFASNKEINLNTRELASFWSRVSKNDGCWIWNGYRNQDGYGRIRISGRLVMAHRISYAIHKRQPLNKLILHSCDNPACVNPEHLNLGSQLDNIADMDAKNRRKVARGESVGLCKLTSKQVLEIRRLKKEQQISWAILGRMFNVTPRSIRCIVERITWKHI